MEGPRPSLLIQAEQGIQNPVQAENLRKWDSGDREGTKMESKERNIQIEGAIVGLASNLALEKFPGIYKDDPS